MSIANRWDDFRTFSPPAKNHLPPTVIALRNEPVTQTPLSNGWVGLTTFSPPAHHQQPIVTALRIEPVTQTPPSPSHISVSSETSMTNHQPNVLQLSDEEITQDEVAQINNDEPLPNDDNIDPSLFVQVIQNLMPKGPKKTVYCSVCKRNYTGYQQHLKTQKHLKNQRSAAQHVQV